MRLTDTVIALPLRPFLIVLAAVDIGKLGLPPHIAASPDIGLYRIVVIIALFGWTTVARLVRGAALSLGDPRLKTGRVRASGTGPDRAPGPRCRAVRIFCLFSPPYGLPFPRRLRGSASVVRSSCGGRLFRGFAPTILRETLSPVFFRLSHPLRECLCYPLTANTGCRRRGAIHAFLPVPSLPLPVCLVAPLLLPARRGICVSTRFDSPESWPSALSHVRLMRAERAPSIPADSGIPS